TTFSRALPQYSSLPAEARLAVARHFGATPLQSSNSFRPRLRPAPRQSAADFSPRQRSALRSRLQSRDIFEIQWQPLRGPARPILHRELGGDPSREVRGALRSDNAMIPRDQSEAAARADYSVGF